MDDLPNHGNLSDDAVALDAPTTATAFRIAVLGDFSGRGNQPAPKGKSRIDLEALRGRKGIRIDADDFDEAIATLAPRALIRHGKETIEVAFAAIDDFDAEEIIARTPRFRTVATADRATLLATILHDPGFRALERTWRGVDWLRRKAIRQGQRVEIVLHDVNEAELTAAVNDVEDLAESPLHAWLVERSVKLNARQPWGVVVGLHGTEMTVAAARVLTRIGQIVRRAGAPYLTEIRSPVWEKSFDAGEEHAEAWQTLRRDPVAANIGLAASGFLVRLPYGTKGKTAGPFPFEESTVGGDKAQLLFASPALGCAALLAMTFAKQGWALRPGSETGLAQMPAHAARDGEGDEILVTVETPLTQRSVESLAAKGVMALQGVQGRDEVRMNRFLSLLKPREDELAAALAGSWGQGSLGRATGKKEEPFGGGVDSSPAAAAAKSLEEHQAEMDALSEALKLAPSRPGDHDWPSKDDDDKDDDEDSDDDEPDDSDADDEDEADEDSDADDEDEDDEDSDDDEPPVKKGAGGKKADKKTAKKAAKGKKSSDDDEDEDDAELAALLKKLGSSDDDDSDDDEPDDEPPVKKGAGGKKAAKKATKKVAKKGAKRKKP